MIYQFTHRGITKCRDCPMRNSDVFGDYDKCNLSGKLILSENSTVPDDCPLVEVND